MRVRSLALVVGLLAFRAGAQSPDGPPPMPPPEPSVQAPASAQEEPEPLGRRLRERYEYEGTVPPGYHLVSRVRLGLIIPGGVMFLAGWLYTGVSIQGNALGWVPIVGSIYGAGTGFSAGGNAIAGVSYLVMGLVQIAGVIMTAVGFASPNRWVERDLQKPRVTLAPGAGSSPLGASLVGLF